jgi:hypothetical protein
MIILRCIQEPAAQEGGADAAEATAASGDNKRAGAMADLRGALALLSMAAPAAPESIADHLDLLLKVTARA